MGPLEALGVASHMVEDGVTSILYLRNCAGVTTWIWVPQVTAADLLGEPRSKIDEAHLPKPQPVLSPINAEHGWGYVQVPTAFRTDAASWKPVSVSASFDGPTPVWAEVTATPSVLWFTPGDGEARVACQGPAALAAYDVRCAGCSYTYHQSSAGQPGEKFAASLAVEWTICVPDVGG